MLISLVCVEGYLLVTYMYLLLVGYLRFTYLWMVYSCMHVHVECCLCIDMCSRIP